MVSILYLGQQYELPFDRNKGYFTIYLVKIVTYWRYCFHFYLHFIFNSCFKLLPKIHVVFEYLAKSKLSWIMLLNTLVATDFEILENVVARVHAWALVGNYWVEGADEWVHCLFNWPSSYLINLCDSQTMGGWRLCLVNETTWQCVNDIEAWVSANLVHH
jgi:hypothetical protein